ncbi:MAG: bifunctional YncE family protein/alkaline phosphatase family protein [Ignavibacteria bacterium]|nr:bifunctional YncE family protein/alkaline phosphatase family protein [Ignavibacteria bacterium]MCU7504678.1 bifunctional YncE family protein/alkaline phosphatase family protein [Ignavibacteria bacterium]MCU7517514.1 bifunctional YncE family protein/alkaline phosphatase family protein [Ignavibacteria bacterium]
MSPDERYAITTNNGQSKPTLNVVDLKKGETVQTVHAQNLWVGIKFFDGGKKLAVSGGTSGRITIYSFKDGVLTESDSIVIAQKWPKEKVWLAGLDIDEAEGRMYVADRFGEAFYVVDMKTKSVISKTDLPSKPYTCLVSRNGNYVYISLWGGSAVALLDKNTLKIEKTIPAGNHPNDIVESPDGNYLYISNANDNTVSIIDVKKGKEIEKINAALSPDAPPGSTPNGVALSGDGKRLYIANADNNSLALTDVSKPGESRSLGFIPTGWYPTSVKVLSDNTIIVANGKGSRSMANPKGPNPYARSEGEQYIGTLLKGTLSIIEAPEPEDMKEYSQAVYRNSPFTNRPDYQKEALQDSPIPLKDGLKSGKIKHVFYIVKENRTYDQVFGDMKEGNGDESLCLFPEKVTPNLHALARQFVLLDNFYADAEVSADGHNWTMGAYATDYVEKSWPNYYGGRGGQYEFEGGYPVAYPRNGYFWDNCMRNNVTYRSYGEFAHNGKTDQDSSKAAIKSLEGHVAPYYWGWDLGYSDLERVKHWMQEFDEYEKNGGLPEFQVLRLPNDHTWGTSTGRLTPSAYAAQNDVALGMLVERITRSKYWNESAIFIIEDDAQNGPDHVDAHRTEALVVSPYTKHKFVDHDMYSTSSMIRTMELVLGLPPMSQYDASARPMYNSFSSEADLTPYVAKKANVDLNEKNRKGAFGQIKSDNMDFSKEDAINDNDLNEVIWKSVKGELSEMPAPVRSAFISYRADEAEDDDDD